MYAPTAQIRDILNIPASFRAMPVKIRKRSEKSLPDQALVARQNQLRQAGISADIKYDKLTRSHYLSYNPAAKNIPAWS